MLIKFIYKLSLTIIFTILAPLYSLAFDIEIRPEEVIPGNIFLLKVHSNTTSSPEAKFLDKEINFYPARDGYFIALVPVDIDTPPKNHKILIKYGEERQYVSIRIKLYKFPTQKLTLPEEKVILSPENLKRAKREAAVLKKLWVKNTARAWNRGFIPPADTAVSEKFGIKRIINEKKISIHRGTDYKGKIGTHVKAVNSGKVVLKENLFFGGNTLIIDHGMGLFSIYMHLARFNVSTGEKISKGQTIGFVGKTGRATGPHLHLSIKLQSINVNPEALMKLEL